MIILDVPGPSNSPAMATIKYKCLSVLLILSWFRNKWHDCTYNVVPLCLSYSSYQVVYGTIRNSWGRFPIHVFHPFIVGANCFDLVVRGKPAFWDRNSIPVAREKNDHRVALFDVRVMKQMCLDAAQNILASGSFVKQDKYVGSRDIEVIDK